MTSYDFGDTVLVPFPFTDQSGIKKRPAVIISSVAYNAARLDLILMAVTSQVRQVMAFGEVMIADWQKAGLLKPSVVKPVMATVERRLIIRQLGRLEQADRAALRKILSVITG
ncbi:MAG TPA: type II toxin-antitoxin system PemK/MazF family toxin [Pyrinomonadaceae bacterium]|nr:type II toxin-antitoxin system PemK/MazF family toxin [Pyrinomonadaceae bacterium]